MLKIPMILAKSGCCVAILLQDMTKRLATIKDDLKQKFFNANQQPC